ncbi:hypothetical protein DNTS_035162 [Danionella cerebrum]|uniref:C2H2-type domain-containing protein n=1 Tax=Danionella cerebrum TaxID=2873325 RepID=A0A553N676_9TELE|nr:hypothetical protein DNTS_035162 [Danionella translucida]
MDPIISESRRERVELLVKQEEASAGDGSFLSRERDEVMSQERAGSVANLRAALMSKNSLLSLGAEILGDENPLLFDYLPKGGHSLSRPRCSNGSSSSQHPAALFASKYEVSSSSPPSTLPPLPLLLPPPPSVPQPPRALSMPLPGSPQEKLFAEQALKSSPTKEEEQEEDNTLSNNAELDHLQDSVKEDQMVEEKHGVCVAEVQGGGPGWRQELACSLCKQLFSSLLQLRQHEYSHTLSLMALSMDCFDYHRPLDTSPSLLNPSPARYHCSQCPASFTLKSNADRHEKTIHLKRKLMQCVYCLKHFRDRTDLNRHLSSVHSSERVYTCHACTRTFSTQKNLATHTKVCCQLGMSPTEQLWNLQSLQDEDHGHIDIDD